YQWKVGGTAVKEGIDQECIETVKHRGVRFTYPVTAVDSPPAPVVSHPTPVVDRLPQQLPVAVQSDRLRFRSLTISTIAVVALAVASLAMSDWISNVRDLHGVETTALTNASIP